MALATENCASAQCVVRGILRHRERLDTFLYLLHRKSNKRVWHD